MSSNPNGNKDKISEAKSRSPTKTVAKAFKSATVSVQTKTPLIRGVRDTGGKTGEIPICTAEEPSNKELPKEQLTIPKWTHDVDRFTNFVTEKFSPKELISQLEKIFATLKTESSVYASPPGALTYELHENCFDVTIKLDDLRKCEVRIGVYTYQTETCLLDIQELDGEHFTFSEFFEIFKSGLRGCKIIASKPLSQTFMESYGLDMDIGLEALDEY
jgi:hypothetical protein